MAFVLTLPPQSPLKRSFSDNPYMQSCSSLGSNGSTGTVQRHRTRQVSVGSFISIVSLRAGSWHKGHENTPPRSHSNTNLIEGLRPEVPRSTSDCVSQQSSRLSRQEPPPPSQPAAISSLRCLATHLPEVVLQEQHDQKSSLGPADESEGRDAEKESFELVRETNSAHEYGDREQDAFKGSQPSPQAEQDEPWTFKRWMSTLRRKNKEKRQGPTPLSERRNQSESSTTNIRQQSRHRKSESNTSSSLAFVTAVRSATMTLASVSVAPRRGDRTSHMRSGHRSSGFSNDEGGRRSMDSNVFGPAMDRQAWERAQQRRKILEELVGTEEGYVADLKALIDVYFTLLASMPWLSTQTSSSIHQNISDILRLHEELLDELHRVIPYSEFSPDEGKQTFLITARKHMRWHSADVIPGRVSAIRGAARDHRRSLDLRGPVGENPVGATADSCTAAAVAQVFDRLLSRFFVYQEYSAKYEIMLQDQETTQRALPTWQTYERGIEALSKSLSSVNNREASRKKALAFADLLAKPLQRVCKYPLLFKDLCKQTPVYDDPESFAELEKVRYRLEETNREINEAKDDPEKRSLIAASWLLQDRMVLEHETSRAFTFHLLGHVLLCGALHVAYQAKDGVKGHYMVCALYKSCLILATVDKAPPSTYEVVAVVCLVTASIEEADNGKGLQCHTTPHTWKLVFENENRMFELILTACSAKEEEQWRKHLNQRITKEVQDYSEGHYSTQDTLSSLKLGLRSIGTAFGKPQGFVRRMSFHRAATLGPKTLANQVIIKNTQAVNDVKDNSSTTHLPIGRSQSVQTPSHVPTLAPRRIDRVRLETALIDVWTRDILPFPGMGYRRPDNPLRASANTVMRKLSMASIASNFSKRSVSYTGLSHTRTENTGVPAQRPCPAALRKPQPVADKRRKHAVVDFHNAPSAFLPADFELHSPGGKRSRLSSFASTNSERPRTPLTFPVFASRPPGTARIRASDVKGEACSNVVGKSLSDIDYARFDGAAGSLMTVTETRSSDGSEKESTIITKIPKKPRNRLFRFWG